MRHDQFSLHDRSPTDTKGFKPPLKQLHNADNRSNMNMQMHLKEGSTQYLPTRKQTAALLHRTTILMGHAVLSNSCCDVYTLQCQ
jgi:hypothetical protein